jgi:hypothetical protein
MTKVCPRNLPLLRFFDSFPDVPRFDPIFFLLFPPSLSLSLSLFPLSLFISSLSLSRTKTENFSSPAEQGRADFPGLEYHPLFGQTVSYNALFQFFHFAERAKWSRRLITRPRFYRKPSGNPAVLKQINYFLRCCFSSKATLEEKSNKLNILARRRTILKSVAAALKNSLSCVVRCSSEASSVVLLLFSNIVQTADPAGNNYF